MGDQRLDVATVRAWAELAAELLASARADLDAGNVFPIADGDTGSNLAVTARGAADALAADPGVTGLDAALRRLATGAVRSAHGNSGNILSQVFRGLADAAAAGPDTSSWDAAGLRTGLRAAARAARAAVADPVEGTMLSIADAAAHAAEAAGPARAADGADGTTTAAALLDVVCAAARVALARTPEQLAVLAQRGVVDAGAHGLVLVLEALRRVLGGETVDLPDTATTPTRPPAHTGSPDGPGYEVQYLLDLPPAADAADVIATVTGRLHPLGDSLVVADDGAGLWAVHVHVDDVGAAVEAGAAAVGGGGRMSSVRITRFADVTDPAVPRPGRTAVVVAAAHDLGPTRAVFAGLGVAVLAAGDVLPGGEVVVVALGDAATEAAMRHGDRWPGVTVVPAHSVVQTMAAIAVHDPTRRAVDDTVAMAEAAGGCRHAHLSVAAEEGLTIVGRCHPGDVLGHVGGEIVVIGPDEPDVARRLLDRLLASGGELVTVLHTPAAGPLATELAAYARWLGDHLDIDVRAVGPMASPVLLGVE